MSENWGSKWEVLLGPQEFEALSGRSLGGTVCVVFDVLRATSTMLTALANGAAEVVPVQTIEDAVEWRRRDPEVLLGGERGGVRISAELSGGVEFDLGNSPREYSRPRVQGRRIVMTTTNGTRALKACAGARHVFAGALLNRSALVSRLRMIQPERLLLVCSGTGDESAMEDVLGAGALASALEADLGDRRKIGDGWRMAVRLFLEAQSDLHAALASSKNGLRLASMADLAADLEVCSRLDVLDLAPQMDERAVLTAKTSG